MPLLASINNTNKIPNIAPPICASCAIPEPPFFIAKYSYAKYRGPRIYALIGIGINNSMSSSSGFHIIVAKTTEETAPDAPRDLYIELSEFLINGNIVAAIPPKR